MHDEFNVAISDALHGVCGTDGPGDAVNELLYPYDDSPDTYWIAFKLENNSWKQNASISDEPNIGICAAAYVAAFWFVNIW